MGSVWRAEHVELGTPAAIKLIDAGLVQSPDALARFRREARAAATLRSAHVVQIFDYGVENGTPYIAMELLQGESLATRIQRLGKLSLAATVRTLSQVARALRRAHESGIVHRDLKPDNIFLADESGDEIVKLLDFGIAKASAETAVPSFTQTGAMLGTPYYMSPEQASGKREVDHRTDIWAFGVIAFQCLTGTLPFTSDTIGGLVLAICAEPIPVPSRAGAVPPGFDEWFDRSLQREPQQRFQSIAEAMAGLEEIAARAGYASSEVTAGIPTPASFESSQFQGTQAALAASVGGAEVSAPVRRTRLWWGLAAVVVAGVGVGVASLAGRWSPSPSSSSSSQDPAQLAPTNKPTDTTPRPREPDVAPSAVSREPAIGPTASATPAAPPRPGRPTTKAPLSSPSRTSAPEPRPANLTPEQRLAF